MGDSRDSCDVPLIWQLVLARSGCSSFSLCRGVTHDYRKQSIPGLMSEVCRHCDGQVLVPTNKQKCVFDFKSSAKRRVSVFQIKVIRYITLIFYWWSSVELTLSHWGRVTHLCVGIVTIIGSDNGLSHDRRQATIWTNAGILFIGPLGTNL